MKRDRAENLFNLLGEIDEEIIAEADVVEKKPAQILPMSRKKRMTRYATIAASIAFLLVCAWAIRDFLGQTRHYDEMLLAAEEAEDVGDGDWDDEVVMDAEDDAAEEAEVSMESEILAEAGEQLDVALNAEVVLEELRLSGAITNNSDTLIGVGHPSIEYFDGEEWVGLEAYLSYTTLKTQIAPREEYEFEMDLSWYSEWHGASGGYLLRMRKEIWPNGGELYEADFYQEIIYEFELD